MVLGDMHEPGEGKVSCWRVSVGIHRGKELNLIVISVADLVPEAVIEFYLTC